MLLYPPEVTFQDHVQDPRRHIISTYTLADIAEKVFGVLDGDPSLTIAGVEQIDLAKPHQLTFIGGKSYVPLWKDSKATAALVKEDLALEPGSGRALIRVKDADLALAIVLVLFEPAPPVSESGIHPQAIVHPTAQIADGVTIGAGCYVGAEVRIGPGTKLYPNVTILDATTIGAQCIFWPHVVIRDRCTIGNGVILHPNVSIGGDGFGYRPSADGRGVVKLPHIGTVTLHDGVEIGANSSVDRGKFSATVIGMGTKIDNQVQIGHNCRIGRCCLIAACTGVAGSVTMGDGVMVGGCVAIKDHTTIGSGARIGGGSGVASDVPAGHTYVGYPAADHQQTLRQWSALRKLPDLIKKLKKTGNA